MQKLYKILIIILLFCFSYIYAEDILEGKEIENVEVIVENVIDSSYNTNTIINRLSTQKKDNFSQATFEGAEKVSGEYLNERYVKKIIGCATCGMRCDHIAVVPEGEYKGSTSRVEFECLWAVGPLCGVDRLDAIIEAIRLADYYGMDGISIGVIVAFAMDLYENGIITQKDTDSLDLSFGNHEALVEMIKRIGTRTGWLGNVLAEGTMRAAKEIGKGAEKYANHIKGLELPGYDLRTLKTAALGFSVSFRGACHLRSGSYSPDVKGKVDRFKIEKGRGKLVMDGEDLYNVVDSLILCKFSRGVMYDGLKDMANYYTLATGLEMTPEEYETFKTKYNGQKVRIACLAGDPDVAYNETTEEFNPTVGDKFEYSHIFKLRCINNPVDGAEWQAGIFQS